ncbi:hypothetical protein PR202_gb24831 [Eleusine coracana subsp. coracana]|uniref:Uncharacterized protein n=1 Tax=Eleusine coracana subsp. coracana TaxID=191504 RepID=A0AAV5FMP2_ELECO|nr:hypothetical protein PR202_gb24831 [Eleusine coracana subsp. coracana]
MLVTLVALVIVAAISISLAPAHLSFSISNATTSLIPVEGHPNLRNGFYNLTLVTINTSRRMWVHYSSLSTRIWYSSTAYILAEDVNTTTALPRWQRPRNSTAVAIYADYGQYDETGTPVPGTAMTGKQLDAEKAAVNCRVVVETRCGSSSGCCPPSRTPSG